MHFLVPFVVLGAVASHLLILHFSGRSVSGGLSASRGLKIKFSQLFLYKDIVNLIFLIGM